MIIHFKGVEVFTHFKTCWNDQLHALF